MSVLPQSWATVRLGDFVARTSNVDPGKAQDQRFELWSVPSFAEGRPDTPLGAEIRSSKQTVQPGDVLLCKIVPHINRVWVVREATGLPQIASGEWIVYRDHGCDPHYLRYCLSEQSFRDRFMETVSGVGGSLMRARPAAVSEIAVPIAPLAEQQRIVAKLDALTARTARARADLDRVPALSTRYKQEILAMAFSGKLTTSSDAVWHDPVPQPEDGEGISGRSPPGGPLPTGWVWTSVGSVTHVSGGLTKNAKREVLPMQVPYLRVANVYANELRLDDLATIGCTAAELQKTKIEPGDLLVVEGNGSLNQVGRTAVWRGEIDTCSHQNHLIRVRPQDGLVPEYAAYWLSSPLGRGALEGVASSSSGLHTLSVSKIKALPIPMCSRDEQSEIVARLNTAFTEIERLTAEAAAARRLLDRLDQAILAEAFRGELVPQDPADEPASALLDRIRAERAAAPAKARRGRATAPQEVAHG